MHQAADPKRLWPKAETILLRGARLVDPLQGIDGRRDLFLRRGTVEGIAPQITREADLVVELDGLVCAPGFGDLHVHFREPGGEDAETIASGSHAAAVGGFTRVACMPNTQPAIDTRGQVEFVQQRGAEAGWCRVRPVAAATRGRLGQELSDLRELVGAGAVAVSDDGSPVASSRVMRRLLEYARTWDILVITHAEDPELSAEGVMNEGYWSTVLGLRGNPSASEAIAIGRDIRLAELAGARLHVAHVSTREGVELVRAAKARGVRVTAETAPHYIALTEERLATYDTSFKVAPPLRTEEDRQAILAGLRDGTLDLIATDHAPHTQMAKDQELSTAPSGMIGLETAVGVVIEHLHHRAGLDLSAIVRLLSAGPASIAGWGGGSVRMGEPADLTVFDPEGVWVVDPDSFVSKGRNCPFRGERLRGRVRLTICAGRLTHEERVTFQPSERLQLQIG